MLHYLLKLPGGPAHWTVLVVLQPLLNAVEMKYVCAGAYARDTLDWVGALVADGVELLLADEAGFLWYFPTPPVFQVELRDFYFCLH